MLREIVERKDKTINVDKGDDPSDIKYGYMVRVGGQTYKCTYEMGDNYSFMLEDEKGNSFIYNAMDDDISPYV